MKFSSMVFKVLENATVVTPGRDQDVVENAEVVIEDKVIVKVAESGSEAYPDKAEVIDLRGKTVIPGLVNAHSHMEMSSVEQVLAEQSSNQILLETLPIVQDIWDGKRTELVKSGYEYGCYNFLKTGITTVNTMDYRPEIGADIIKEAGMRAVVGHVGTDMFLKAGREEILEREKAFIEEYRESSRITPSISTEGDLFCSRRLWEDIGRLRSEYPELPFHTHILELPESREMSKVNGSEGTTQLLEELGLLDERSVLAHFTHADEVDYRTFKRKSVGLAHCPSVLEVYDYNDSWPNVDKADGKGIRTGIGLDDHYLVDNDNLFDEARKARDKLEEERDYCISPESLFRKMTLEGAQALGLGEVTGSIEEGKKADLVVLDIDLASEEEIYSKLVESASEDVESVFVGGEQVVDQGIVTTLDRENILERKSKVESDIRDELDKRFLKIRLLVRTLSIIDWRVIKLIPQKLKSKFVEN